MESAKAGGYKWEIDLRNQIYAGGDRSVIPAKVGAIFKIIMPPIEKHVEICLLGS